MGTRKFLGLLILAVLGACAMPEVHFHAEPLGDAGEVGADRADQGDASDSPMDRDLDVPTEGGINAVVDGPDATDTGPSDGGCGEGRLLCAGMCVDPRADPAHCGACGMECSFGHAAARCMDGRCMLGTCHTNWDDCDHNDTNGCEINLQTSLMNCNGCGMVCSITGAVAECQMGRCVPSMCSTGRGDCDSDRTNGCETNLTSDATHCGDCGTTCATVFPHATGVCTASRCAFGTCAAGWGNCNGNTTDGCETNLLSDVTHCGSCPMACSFAHAGASCSLGACAMGACTLGWQDCNSSSGDGCEVNSATDVNHCGMCGNRCAVPNATAACGSGACRVGTCNAGFMDCNAMPGDGCETWTAGDPTHCGGCSTVCSVPNATSVCSSGMCGLGSCASGFANCDGMASNGCEINLMTDALHCGACPTVCVRTNGTAVCMAGACRLGMCNTGYGNCDGNDANGCEVNLRTTVTSCGACGNTCMLANATATCTAGACAVLACTGTYRNCNLLAADGCEVNTQNNISHCGVCNNVCPTVTGRTTTCTAGVCGSSACAAGMGDCDSNGSCETNTNTSLDHCGACGNACPTPANATRSCTAGACGFACVTGFGNCDGTATNGCEADLNTGPTNCMTCGHVCTFDHATANCVAGTCTMGGCRAGYRDCDGMPANGCEVAFNSDPNNCGMCAVRCQPAQATGSCSSGICGIASCNPGFQNCDGNVANGCEIYTAGDVSHCGTCTTVCSYPGGTPACIGGACQLSSCVSPYANCDGMAGNGCEANTQTSTTHCGTCGHACSYANAAALCSSGTCAMGMCSAGYGNCDTMPGNGCETNLNTSVAHCGACGNVCSFPHATVASCTGGSCVMGGCNVGWGNCDGMAANGCETNLTASGANCGACGTMCLVGANMTANVCTSGVCVPTCVTSYGNCDGNAANGCETNLGTSMMHCGACGTTCTTPAGTTTNPCVAGVCVPVCDGTHGDCDTSRPNGCETSTQTSVSHCGGCGMACMLPHATQSCVGGACAIGMCSAGWGDCDGMVPDGCETDLQTDEMHCGDCSTVCSGGTPTCTGGICMH